MAAGYAGISTVNVAGSVDTTSSLPTPSSSQTIKAASTSKSGQAIVAGTGYVLHSVTANKTFYMTSFHIDNGNLASTIFEVRDGAGGALKLAGRTGDSIYIYPREIVLPTPIAFTSGVFVDTNVNVTAVMCCSGFEQ